MTTIRNWILAALVAAGPASAKTGTEWLLECRAMSDATARLECYDKLGDAAKGNSAPPPTGTYQPMSFSDFITDAQELKDQKVELSGYVSFDPDHSTLHKSQSDFKPYAWLSVDKLSRDDRKRLLDRCIPGCVATVDGTVQAGYGSPQIIAEAIRFGN